MTPVNCVDAVSIMFTDDDEPTVDPLTGQKYWSEDVRAAKRLCNGHGPTPEPCWFREQCLQGALDRQEPYGVWGGLATPERDEILRRRQAAIRRSKRREAANVGQGVLV